MKIQILKIVLIALVAHKLSGFFVEQNDQNTNTDSQITDDSQKSDDNDPAIPPQISTTSFFPPNFPSFPHPQPPIKQDFIVEEKKKATNDNIQKAIFSFALPVIKKIGDNIFNRFEGLFARMKDQSENHKQKIKRCLLNFENFKSKFGKKFKSEDSEAHGLENFEQNLDLVENCNKKTNIKYKLGLNEYADLSWEKFQDRFLMKTAEMFKDNNHLLKNLKDFGSKASFFKAKTPVVGNSFTEYSHKRLLQSVSPIKFAQDIGVPTSVNWKKYATPVKDQGRCNSCYAFAGIGALEAAIAKKYGSTSILSEQEQISCSSWDLGCSGGDPFNSVMYHMYYGSAKNENFPYESGQTRQTGTCKYLDYDSKVYSPVNARYISGDVTSFLKALAEGPVSVIHEVNREFSLYSSGVYDKQSCGSSLNHSGVAVAYYLDVPVPYILVKNAWKPTWGEEGYYKLAIGPLTGSNRGSCGFLSHDYTSQPYYPY